MTAAAAFASPKLVAGFQRALVERHMGLARRYAHSFHHGDGPSQQDLASAAFEGLVKAAARYVPSRSRGGFPAYAVWWIRRELHRAVLQRRGDPVQRPKNAVERARRLAAAERQLSQEAGRPVRAEEVAAETGMAVADYSALRGLLTVRTVGDVEEDGRAYAHVSPPEEGPDGLDGLSETLRAVCDGVSVRALAAEAGVPVAALRSTLTAELRGWIG